MHVKCTGKHVLSTKKSRTLKTCYMCKDAHVKGVFLKRMRLMTKIKNALDTMTLLRIKDGQVVQLAKFSCNTSYKNPTKTKLIQQTINYCR